MLVYQAISEDISKLYPGALKWYEEKVLQHPSKEILRFPYGFAIIDHKKKKICTLFIYDGLRGVGYGPKLFKKCFEALGTNKPVISISEETLPSMMSILLHYDFVLTRVVSGAYRDGKKEFFFNE